ncbi:hypothetical protein [Bacillus sp. FSL K6-3431]|uniref:hypothetical protein n=1 Tax=Bacillus sp. FSL K6-3431 TaxID=2921500 RepID=UPI0030F71758
MDVEQQLREDLKKEASSIRPPEHLNKQVATSFDKYIQRNTKVQTRMKKRLITGVIAATFLIPTGVFAGTTVIPSFLEKTIGTPDKANEEWNITKEGYEERLHVMEAAEKYLTKEEFNHYLDLESERILLFKKAKIQGHIRPVDLDRLNPEDKKKLQFNDEQHSQYWDKIMTHFIYTKEEAQKIMGYTIQSPTYTSEGFSFLKEEISPDITIKNPKPIIISMYKNGEFGYSIHQSELLNNSRDPFEIRFDIIEQYQLHGNQVIFGKYSDSNVKGMKMIIPAKEGIPAKQIVIIDDILNKEELEKIMLSLLN